MRALVISGGGSKGAYAGGVAEYLISDLGINYNLFIGTSIGSLLCPYLAMGEVDKIKSMMLSATQHDIFSNSPFKVKKLADGTNKISINHFNVLKNFISGSKTFGESYSLKEYIRHNFTKEDYEKLKSMNKNVICTVSNLSLSTIEYKSIRDNSYFDFIDWIWMSCNFIPFMTLAKKNNNFYADGGLGVSVGIEEAIRRGATTIDTIILDVEKKEIKSREIDNPFSLLSVMYNFTKSILEYQNIVVAENFAKERKGICINYYYTPDKLTSNALIIDNEYMKKWWQMGYDYAKNKSNH